MNILQNNVVNEIVLEVWERAGASSDQVAHSGRFGQGINRLLHNLAGRIADFNLGSDDEATAAAIEGVLIYNGVEDTDAFEIAADAAVRLAAAVEARR